MKKFNELINTVSKCLKVFQKQSTEKNVSKLSKLNQLNSVDIFRVNLSHDNEKRSDIQLFNRH